jgi:hypothetical protein
MMVVIQHVHSIYGGQDVFGYCVYSNAVHYRPLMSAAPFLQQLQRYFFTRLHCQVDRVNDF